MKYAVGKAEKGDRWQKAVEELIAVAKDIVECEEFSGSDFNRLKEILGRLDD